MSSCSSSKFSHMSLKFQSLLKGTYRLTRQIRPLQPKSEGESGNKKKVESHIGNEIEMLTDINSTRCFRLGPVMMAKGLEVNDDNFPPLTTDQSVVGCASGVSKEIKSGHTMKPGKVLYG